MTQRYFSPTLLAGKNIIITGSTSGIGLSSAHLLASLGASLCLAGRSVDKLTSVRDSLTNPSAHSVMNADLSVPGALYHNLTALGSFGRFDGIFHSAGNGLIKPAKLANLSDATDIMNPSLLATIDIGKIASSKSLVNDNASVVLMSSVAAITGTSCMTLYSASKGAINSFAKSLAIELAPKGIRVNTIVAGAVDTNMHQSMIRTFSNAMIDDYIKRHPLGIGSVEDVANAVAFLLSPLSRWITGSSLVIDGGYSAQ